MSDERQDADAPPVLELRDVRKSYPGGVETLHEVSLSVGDRKSTCLNSSH